MFAKKEAAAAQAQAAKEAKWDTAAAGNEWEKEEAEMMKAFTCSSCGAEIVSDGNTMATECCYCGNPTMLPSRFAGMLKPDFIIPFKKSKEEAVAALKKFYEGKKLLPDAFTANNRVEAIQGMYVPFWLFDADIDAQGMYKASCSTTVTTEDEIVTTTDYYNCERAGTMKFERIPVDGSEKMDDTFMESIEPFDYSEMVPFSSAYFTGYLADKYDVDAEAAVDRADERVNTSAKLCLASTVDPCISSTIPSSSLAFSRLVILRLRSSRSMSTPIINESIGGHSRSGIGLFKLCSSISIALMAR